MLCEGCHNPDPDTCCQEYQSRDRDSSMHRVIRPMTIYVVKWLGDLAPTMRYQHRKTRFGRPWSRSSVRDVLKRR